MDLDFSMVAFKCCVIYTANVIYNFLIDMKEKASTKISVTVDLKFIILTKN